MKPGLHTKDTSLETSADYMPDLVKDRKVHFMLEDLEEDATNAMDEEACEHDTDRDNDQDESSSEEQSSDSDIGDTTDTGDTNDGSDISEDSVTVQGESSELRRSPDPLQSQSLKIDQLFQQFIEQGQSPSLKLSSLDQMTR